LPYEPESAHFIWAFTLWVFVVSGRQEGPYAFWSQAFCKRWSWPSAFLLTVIVLFCLGNFKWRLLTFCFPFFLLYFGSSASHLEWAHDVRWRAWLITKWKPWIRGLPLLLWNSSCNFLMLYLWDSDHAIIRRL
jgi:hypothetical protein